LTGSSRLSQEARERAAELARRQEAEGKQRERSRKRDALEARVAALRKEFEVEEEEAERSGSQEVLRESVLAESRGAMARSRKADATQVVGSSSRRGANEKISKYE
jgi:circadian clock protein KaiC